HPPPIGLRRGDQRKKREGGAGRGEKVNRGGGQARAHAPSGTASAMRFVESNGLATGRAPCGAASPLEVALDLAEHGKVFIVINSRALLQVHRLRLAIEQLEAEIELGQDAEAKHLRATLLRCWRRCLGG